VATFTFAELTPTSFLERSAHVMSDRVAVIDGDRQLTYAEMHERALRLTGLLAGLGVEPTDRVAALCTNSSTMLEAHHGVPMAGAVLVPLNVRLSVAEMAHILTHSGAKVLIATEDLAEAATEVGARAGARVVLAGADSKYEALLASATPRPNPCQDERDLLAINYTSGTTGTPKGVMYNHRGATLQALAMAFHTRMTAETRYLWTLPMFHCNGWCFTWAVFAAGGTNVCLRRIDPTEIWRLLRTERITSFSAAPTVLSMIAAAPEASEGEALTPRVRVDTGGAPPSPALLAELSGLGMDVTHLYGLTETYGPIAINEWHPEWDDRPGTEQSVLKARQGVGNVIAQPLRVVDAEGTDVPADGETVGEIVARGNDVMLGYYRDPAATESANLGGWFKTGDLAVMHADHYVEIKDRAKDIIVSGGENISSVDVEKTLAEHAAVLEAAVVGLPDERWGEIPVAYVVLRSGATATEEELREHVRSRIARFKAPRHIIFAELPRTSTGKIQKHVLRSRAPEDVGRTP
jgi:fatty-acyl-CoA synthase